MLGLAAAMNAQAGAVTDVDGNVYQTMNINGVEWMIENLKVRHYQDGSAITYDPNPQTSSADDWRGYYKYPNGDPANAAAYGLLYSWGAAFDENGGVPVPKPICPDSSWAVPTLDDWRAIELLPAGFNPQYAGDCNATGYTQFLGQLRAWTATLVMPGTGAGAYYMLVDTAQPGAARQEQYRNVNTASIRCISRNAPGPGTQTVDLPTISGSLQASIRQVYKGALSDVGTLVVHAGTIANADYAFIGDSLDGIATVALLDSVTSATGDLPEGSFAGKDYLQTVTLPTNITSIGPRTFTGSSALTSVNLYSTQATIVGVSAFQNCTSLKYIGLPATLSILGVDAFNGCSMLDFIEIPANMTFIRLRAFAGCTALRYVAIADSTPPQVVSGAFPSGIPLYVPSGYVSTYSNWGGGRWSSITGIVDILGTLDVSIYSMYQDNSNSKGSSFPIGTNMSANLAKIRVLTKFGDLSAVPADMDSVWVSIFAIAASSATNPLSVSLFRLDPSKSWTEGSSNADGSPGTGVPATPNDATWIHNIFNTSTWNNPGADFSSPASATLTFTGDVAGGRYIVISGAGLRTDVANWASNPTSNNGWIAIGNETEISSNIVISSREARQAPLYRPRIRIFTPS
jgi:hypothetical protein